MPEHNIDRADLEAVLQLKIPESCTIKIEVTGVEQQAPDGTDGFTPLFNGQMVYTEGQLTELLAIGVDELNLEYFQYGTMGACW